MLEIIVKHFVAKREADEGRDDDIPSPEKPPRTYACVPLMTRLSASLPHELPHLLSILEPLIDLDLIYMQATAR